MNKIITCCLLLLLAACGQNSSTQPAGIKLGKPYVVGGTRYVPQYKPNYDETGIASWYGPGFHGGRTANGERYDQDDLTAAHKTLPLPSIVRVTNLNNGRSAIVRINDRGPFANNRIIDLSHAAASKLGIIKMGTARVRVQFLDKETREYVMNMPNGAASLRRLDMARNAPVPSAYDEPTSLDTEPLPFAAPVSVYKTPPVIVAQIKKEPVSAIHAVPVIETQATRRIIDTNSYYIQAGTFGVRNNAEKLLQKLQAMGDARVVENGSQKKLYRVLAGPYDSRGSAEIMLGKLDHMGIAGAKIIRD